MACKEFKLIKKYLSEDYPLDLVDAIIKHAEIHYKALCEENNDDPKAVKKHTEHDIFPCVSLYLAMQETKISKDEALDFLDRSWSRKAMKNVKSTKMLLKCFGLYKLYPKIFEMVAKKEYGEAAHFKAKFYNVGKGHCKFDMQTCLYCDTLKRCGCLELLKCFCHTDDINNQDLHKRLIWNRTKYMGKGDDFCDFDIYLSDK